MEIHPRRRVPLPREPEPLLRYRWNGNADLRRVVRHLWPRARGGLLPVQPRCPSHGLHRAVRSDGGHRRLHRRIVLQADGWHELGAKRNHDVLPVLRTAAGDVRLPEHRRDRLPIDRRTAIRNDRDHHHHLGAHHVPADGARRHRGQKQQDGILRARSHDKVPARRPAASVVQVDDPADVHGRLLAIQRDLHRAVLHLRVGVGTQGVHHLLDPLCRVHDPARRHELHYHRADILPACGGGSSLVVA
mmetsp:Transcript_13792/g.34466  ORF Transcript_13792/g.34466 Transcript_13792/m.34466 type:complete len:246 (+) Transcript_13792:950-1687(+)